MRRLAIALCVAACDRREPITSCDDNLAGVWEVETTATEREPARWHVLDARPRGTLEAYPLFDDTAAPVEGLEIAPRAIDLDRQLAGTVTRRYMAGSRRCDAKATARVVACKDDRLEIVLADPVPPIAFDPCAWGQGAPSRRERWRRTR